MESKRERWWLEKDSNAAFPDLSSAHLLSGAEGENAEQSHEKKNQERSVCRFASFEQSEPAAEVSIPKSIRTTV